MLERAKTQVSYPYIIEHADNTKACIIFAHGAGADQHHCFINDVTRLFLEQHVSVVRFNFPYMEKRLLDGKRRPPDRMPTLQACYETVIAQIFALHMELPLFIGGKSMGSRVAATILSDPEHGLNDVITGGFCIGYPFHPQKKPENLRLAPLQHTTKPILICQGSRDALGNEAEIRTYEYSKLCQVVYLPDGDHDLKPRVKSGFTHQQHKKLAVDNIVQFINKHVLTSYA